MAVKLQDLAKELEITNEELIEALQKLYVEVEDEGSRINDKIADLMRVKLGVSKPEAKKEKKVKAVKKPAADSKKTGTPDKKKAKSPGSAGVLAVDTTSVSAGLIEDKENASKTAVRPRKKKQKISSVESSTPQEESQVVSPPASAAKESDIPQTYVDEQKRTAEAPETAGFAGTIPVERAVTAEKKESKKESKKDVAKEHYTFRYQQNKRPEIISRDAAKGAGTSGTKDFARGFRNKPFGKKSRRDTGHMIPGQQPKIAFEEIQVYQGTEFQKIQLQVPISIRALAVKINKRPNDLIQHIMGKGIFANINQDLDETLVRDLLKDLGYELELNKTIEEDLMAEHEDTGKEFTEKRAPVVTFMGHVDHGKTSLLDYIRKTMVTKKEKGGITQHVGAYKVATSRGSITFLDTPGHAAFTAMRARGADITDIVVLVVAADDGVMPQTKEAIDHARAASVPIVVAINKCDLPGANPEKVKIGLQKEGIVSEDFGGKTVMMGVSAITGEGVDGLLEMILMEAELLELRANPKLHARGIVIESKKSSSHGASATVLVKNGILREGDIILIGMFYGKVKAMIDDRGERVHEAPPSTPIEILGLEGVPEAGDEFFVVKDEKKARTLSLLKQSERKRGSISSGKRITLEEFHSRVAEGEIKDLKIVLKADVQGSVGAITQSIQNLSTDEVKVSFVHAMVGDINESDVMLAMVSNAVIIGFHVKIDPKAEALAKQENIDVRVYDVIYESISDIKAAMEGLLEPLEEEILQGVAQIKEVFPSKKGKAAGCIVAKGVMHRKDKVRIRRVKDVIFEGEFAALKRFKDDVKEVKDGFECGASFNNFDGFRAGDVIETYIIKKVARRLEK